jgi:hypothetical protein
MCDRPLADAVTMLPLTTSHNTPPAPLLRQPHEIYVNEGSKLTLHGLQQYVSGVCTCTLHSRMRALLDTTCSCKRARRIANLSISSTHWNSIRSVIVAL